MAGSISFAANQVAAALLAATVLSGCVHGNSPSVNSGVGASSGSSSSGGGSSSTSSGSSSGSSGSGSSPAAVWLPTGQTITPTAAPGSTTQTLVTQSLTEPGFAVSQAMSEALSPDQKTLLILTSGYNKLLIDEVAPSNPPEWVFVYDVSGAKPQLKQTLSVPYTFAGIAFAPDGSRFYVSGGMNDEVHTFALSGSQWAESGQPIALGHKSGNGLGQGPVSSGLAVTADGQRLVVANFENDSVSVLNLGSGTVAAELDLRPGKNGGAPGTPGGTYPFWVTIAGSTAYVSSERDREIDVLDISGASPSLVTRIPLPGNPGKMILNKAQTTLYTVMDNADAVAVIDTATNTVTQSIAATTPSSTVGDATRFRGAAPNSLALSPDESTLYVTDGGTNAVAVIPLGGTAPAVSGLIPTGWYPQAVVVGGGGKTLYVVNSKSEPGPNDTLRGFYVLQLEKAGFQTIPVPDAAQLANLTAQVKSNDGFDYSPSAQDAALMQTLHGKIQHVIYIVKENRTYDQVLGDLAEGNGDPLLATFGKATTPNQHAIASQFVDLDNFYDPGEVSGNGWPWSTAARESDYGVKSIPLNYANRGLGYDVEGTDRNVNVALPTVAARQAANPATPSDPDLLAGTGDVAATDGPEGEQQQGYLWSAALRAGISVRNYGFMCDLSRYGSASGAIPEDPTPYADNQVVAYSSTPQLVPLTDPYFRGFDNAFPDFYREIEWEREFAGFVRSGKLPALSLVRFMHDHTGNYSTSLNGVNTPQADVADNDYAVGKLLETLSKSPYAGNTLVFVVEDDAQAGLDHVDAHRSIGFVAGPYVKQGAVITTHYSTVNMLRTIEDVLGIGHLSVYDAYQAPMTDVFDLSQAKWSFSATVPKVIAPCAKGQNSGCSTLPFPSGVALGPEAPRLLHDARWWAARTRGMDFSVEDRLDPVRYDRLLWEGIKGGLPYPAQRSGKDLRRNRAALLAAAERRDARIGIGIGNIP
ncbi:MAG: bifunctional YncE family protein/alkaline phosphatase family protein [Nevskia sp.]|nr:bifunctional YncE family protein/alkaline phosphatase family protein [Nevskia sp.]